MLKNSKSNSKKKLNKGFTVFEILTVVLIITILVLIAVPNFIKSKDDAFESSMKANARTLRIMLETYKVDNQIYPDDLRTLGREASLKGYNKKANNPLKSSGGLVEDGKWAVMYTGTTGPEGMVAYNPLTDLSKYYIMIYDSQGNLLIHKGTVYTMSNG